MEQVFRLPLPVTGPATAALGSAAAQAAANQSTDLLAAMLLELRVANYLRAIHPDLGLNRQDIEQIRQQESKQI